jgi:hypothetical protein
MKVGRPMLYICHFTDPFGQKKVAISQQEMQWLAKKAGRRYIPLNPYTDALGEAQLAVQPKDLRHLAKLAGLFVHTKDNNSIITVGGPKRCHNHKCRCSKGRK